GVAPVGYRCLMRQPVCVGRKSASYLDGMAGCFGETILSESEGLVEESDCPEFGDRWCKAVAVFGDGFAEAEEQGRSDESWLAVEADKALTDENWLALRDYAQPLVYLEENPIQSGMDLWLTLSGSGSGFWSRATPDEGARNALTETAESLTGDVEFDGYKLHV